MLHPVAVFDGDQEYRDFSTMPLVGGLDLQSPAAALRVASRELHAERARAAGLAATIERLEAELTRSTRLAIARGETERNFGAERETWLQQRVALQAGRNALEGELAKTRSQLSAAVDLRAQRDSQIAQLRAEIADAAQQLETETKEWGSARLRLESENRHLQVQLAALSHQNEELRRNAALLEEQAIEITHSIGPLLEEIDQLRGANRLLAAERETASQERMKLEMQIAASPGARLRALRRRLGQRWALPLAVSRVRR
jgi:chromosome segregation ATPase